jgi:hypothetical protein
MTTKSKFILIGISVLILFCGGVIAGYTIWGVSDGEKRDFPALLKEAAQYVAGLENRQSELENQLAAKTQPAVATGESETAAEATPSEAPVETMPSEAPAEGADDKRTKGLEMRLAALQEENAALQTALSSDKSATEKNLELTDRIQILIQAKNTAEQENSMLRDKLAQVQGLAGENEQLKAQIASLTEIKSRLEKEKAEFESADIEKSRLVAENRELDMQVQACADEKAELEKKNAALQVVDNRNQDLLAENQKLKSTIAANADEISTLKLRLDEIRAMTQMKQTSDGQSSGAKTEGGEP